MDAEEVVAGRLGRGGESQVAGEARDVDQVQQAALGLGTFGQARAGLDERAEREGEGVSPAAVPEGAFIGEEGGGHWGCPGWRGG